MFKGVAGDASRNAVQEEFVANIGNPSTLSRSIELACRAEKELFDRCPSSESAIYSETSGMLLAQLKNGNDGLMIQQKLLMGSMSPEEWVKLVAPKNKVAKKPKVETKVATKAAPASTTALPASTSLKSSTTKTDAEGKKSDSSYYFFKSTPKDEAVRYQPKKLDAEAAKVDAAAAPAKHVTQGHSSWNASGSWEERDLDKWAIDTLTTNLAKVTTDGITEGSTSISGSKWDVKGDAALSIGKGKKRVTFELKAKLTFTGSYQEGADEEGKQAVPIEGEFDIPCIDDVDGRDGDYDVYIKVTKPTHSAPAYSTIKKNIRAMEPKLRTVITAFIKELDSQ